MTLSFLQLKTQVIGLWCLGSDREDGAWLAPASILGLHPCPVLPPDPDATAQCSRLPAEAWSLGVGALSCAVALGHWTVNKSKRQVFIELQCLDVMARDLSAFTLQLEVGTASPFLRRSGFLPSLHGTLCLFMLGVCFSRLYPHCRPLEGMSSASPDTGHSGRRPAARKLFRRWSQLWKEELGGGT